MNKEDNYYLELKNKSLIYKSKELIVDMYIEAIKRLDEIAELCENTEYVMRTSDNRFPSVVKVDDVQEIINGVNNETRINK